MSLSYFGIAMLFVVRVIFVGNGDDYDDGCVMERIVVIIIISCFTFFL